MFVVAISGVLIFACVLPKPYIHQLDTVKKAENFFQSLWQVEALALTLTLAIITIVVNVYYFSVKDRYGITILRFMRVAYLSDVYVIGVASILLNGALLLGAGGGVRGGGSLVVIAISFLSILALPILLFRSLAGLHPSFLRKEREQRLVSAVNSQVDSEVLADCARSILRETLQRSSPAPQSQKVSTNAASYQVISKQNGVILDVNLCRLTKLRERLDDVSLNDTLKLWQHISSEYVLLTISGHIMKKDVKLADKAVLVKRSKKSNDQLYSYLEDIGSEALEAIKTDHIQEFEFIEDDYMRTVLEFAYAWRRYGQDYRDNFKQSGIPNQAMDTICRQFIRNVETALRLGYQSLTFTASYLPMKIAMRAMQQGSDYLVTRMLELQSVLLEVAWEHDSKLGKLLADHLASNIHVLPMIVEGKADQGEWDNPAYILTIFHQFEEMMKIAADTGHSEFVQNFDQGWGNFIDGTDKKEEFDRRRNTYRFVLATWVWRQQPVLWERSLQYLVSQIPNLGALSEIAEEIFTGKQQETLGLWAQWERTKSHEGKVGIQFGHDNTAQAMVEGLVVLALRVINPKHSVSKLSGVHWLEPYLPFMATILKGAGEDSRNQSLPDLAERVRWLQEASSV